MAGHSWPQPLQVKLPQANQPPQVKPLQANQPPQANQPLRKAIDKLWEKLQSPPPTQTDRETPSDKDTTEEQAQKTPSDKDTTQQQAQEKNQEKASPAKEGPAEHSTPPPRHLPEKEVAQKEKTTQNTTKPADKPSLAHDPENSNGPESTPSADSESTPSANSAKTSKEPQPQQEPRPTNQNTCTVELKVEGTIGPATLDILNKAIQEVKQQKCASLLLLINTPGGQLLSTRKIVDRILNTPFPVLCLIHPAGAHAGSAGAIIMQACHVNGGLSATNIGAATPITGGGGKMSPDLRKKMINDTSSWLDSLTALRKRSQKFGREIVTEAKALSAKEAQKEKAIDFVGQTKQDFLLFAKGREVTVKDGQSLLVEVGDLIPMKLGFRHSLVSLITEPEIIYILFTGSLMLLYFEITHPGLGAPGILGLMGLVLSFMGMHKLDFSYAGLILILLAMALFLAEVFIAGFGIFGAGGVVSFVLGSVLLFDPAKTGGVDIPLSLIAGVSTVFALIMGLIAYMAYATIRMKKKSSISDDFMDQEALPAEVIQVNEDGCSGLVFINGENWRFKSQKKVQKGQQVRTLRHHHLILEVEPLPTP